MAYSVRDINEGLIVESLTISIPTFNRHDKLLKQLYGLTNSNNQNVKIIVRDNCSEPPVNKYLQEVGFDDRYIEIVRNEVNIGADANIARCFEGCNTDWLWVLSDDDFVSDDAIIQVLKLIELYNDYCYINFSCSNDSLVKTTVGFDEYLFTLKDPIFYINSFWISTCLYNMGKLKSSMKYYYSSLSSMQGQLGFLIKYLETNSNDRCVFLKSNVITQSTEETSWDRIDFIKNSIILLHLFKGDSLSKVRKSLFISQCYVINYFTYNMYLNKCIGRLKVLLFVSTLLIKSKFYILIFKNTLRSTLKIIVAILLPFFVLKHIKR